VSDAEEKMRLLRQEISQLTQVLRALVIQECPGEHLALQHRDRKPPWCRHCGRDDRGVKRRD
jgi:hypothetical protein